MTTIVIDAGHGGFDNGAMYQGRKEKDDNLRLALAVGKLLEKEGYNVIFTRTTDIYQSPYEKAQIANEENADFFISFHRNSGEVDNTYNGVQTLVYGGDEQAERLAESINRELEKEGFVNIGIEERPGLVVLRRTEMPAVLIEAGFINSDKDNQIFDENFDEIAQAIATGIENVIPLYTTMSEGTDPVGTQEKRKDTFIYGVEVGRFLYETTANFLAEQLEDQGFKSYVWKEDGMYHVIAGKENTVEEAFDMQKKLRRLGYRTMIISAEV